MKSKFAPYCARIGSVTGSLLIWFAFSKKGDAEYKGFKLSFNKEYADLMEGLLAEDEWVVVEFLRSSSTGGPYESTVQKKLGWDIGKVKSIFEDLRRKGVVQFNDREKGRSWSLTPIGQQLSRPPKKLYTVD